MRSRASSQFTSFAVPSATACARRSSSATQAAAASLSASSCTASSYRTRSWYGRPASSRPTSPARRLTAGADSNSMHLWTRLRPIRTEAEIPLEFAVFTQDAFQWQRIEAEASRLRRLGKSFRAIGRWRSSEEGACEAGHLRSPASAAVMPLASRGSLGSPARQESCRPLLPLYAGQAMHGSKIAGATALHRSAAAARRKSGPRIDRSWDITESAPGGRTLEDAGQRPAG